MHQNNDLILRNGFKTAQAITKKYAKTFYFASLFLPEDKRQASYTVYAICRISDESVDGAHRSHGTPRELQEIQQNIKAVYADAPLRDGVLLAFRQTVTKYQIPKHYFDELITGMYMDLQKNRYADFNEVYNYCYKVAGVVGLIILKILGYRDSAAEEYAVDLGVAMQLTNILRDIKEDLGRQRIYLAQDSMQRFGVSEDDLKDGLLSQNFKSLMRSYVHQALHYYRSARPGIKMIDNISSRFVACAMKDMYAGILNAIEKNKYNVFSRRAYVTTAGKIAIVLKVLLKGEYL